MHRHIETTYVYKSSICHELLLRVNSQHDELL